MEQLICRTCLKTNLSSTNCVQIYNLVETNQMTIKDMLELFMPEMDLDLFEGEVVMCVQCSDSLRRAYLFKDTCLKTEERIYDYLQQYDIKLGKKISLRNIITHNLAGSKDLGDFKVPEGYLTSVQDSSYLNNTVIKPENPELGKSRKRSHSSGTKKSKSDNSSLKRSYTCDLCEYKAYRLDLLNTHKQKHDKNMLSVKEYKCDFCTYTTLRKRALDRHLFTHKGKSPHLCQICNKPFAEKYQLKLHMITHTGKELPHKCDECGKGYLTKSYLKQHKETRHLPEKCTECDDDECGHATRCYKCNLCEASFTDRRGLEAHTFTHTGGELPYKCPHCSFSTAWKGNLKKHLNNKH
ncbi:zinc finger protein 99 [Tribolium castaneum]|uniref:Zinc finger protein 782-like Protein n=1 Tax=Tribolium castaneum TaxID=7070 RepID=D6WM79_TRICA|nr:PREDICTED: zinc finger protein 99 [Tribolium castaneum]EFA04233.2 Zinc finger protein 782-like Protein [Tribolium castaneum]|eukprot:XP_008193917.1 PREDICTED: zinc finger protein 99 [Tribolium castaneum]